jgi:eukaryotic-like serine/threonine-protein kinase
MQYFKPGQRVRTELSGRECEVVQLLGSGGQGEVYSASLDGQLVALKWYARESATPKQRAALTKIVESGPPNERFLWPLDLATSRQRSEFGYIMPLRPPEYAGLAPLMKGRVRASFRALATAGLQLADSFLQLHSKGLCYCDISFGNVFFNPTNGDVLICDNDNVTVNRSVVDGIMGTPRFMAPEIVRREALPSTQTDLFSLAVLLFSMFNVHHPLEGVKETAIHCLDLAAQTKLYGVSPVFIFDPQDDSNRPDPNYHQTVLQRWPLFPQFFRDLFVRSFTDGIRDAEHGRVRESEWRQAMVRLRDSIVYGPTNAENFYCEQYRKRNNGQLPPCWLAGTPPAVPYRIEIGKQTIVLNHDSKLYPHHIDDARMWDFGEPAAEVSRHPKNPNMWGLKNLSKRRWAATNSKNELVDVEPGRNVGLAEGTQIDFGASKGVVRR